MGGSGGGGSTSTQASVPPELSPLYTQTGQNVQGLQDTLPLSEFATKNPARVAPLSGTQEKSLSALNTQLDALSSPIEESPIVRAGTSYFKNTIAPGIENRATMSGLGRSTALTNALSSAEAQTALPLLQAEQARRDAMIRSGFEGGDIERSVVQQGYNAEQADALRRQGIAEQALFGPLGQLPSTFGQNSVTKTKSEGGLSHICGALHAAGLMSDETREADAKYGSSVGPVVFDGYECWAIHVAVAMRRYRIVMNVVAPIALEWAKEMEKRIAGRGHGSRVGALVLVCGVPICRFIGTVRLWWTKARQSTRSSFASR